MLRSNIFCNYLDTCAEFILLVSMVKKKKCLELPEMAKKLDQKNLFGCQQFWGSKALGIKSFGSDIFGSQICGGSNRFWDTKFVGFKHFQW